jgi:hypothetical protein
LWRCRFRSKGRDPELGGLRVQPVGMADFADLDAPLQRKVWHELHMDSPCYPWHICYRLVARDWAAYSADAVYVYAPVPRRVFAYMDAARAALPAALETATAAKQRALRQGQLAELMSWRAMHWYPFDGTRSGYRMHPSFEANAAIAYIWELRNRGDLSDEQMATVAKFVGALCAQVQRAVDVIERQVKQRKRTAWVERARKRLRDAHGDLPHTLLDMLSYEDQVTVLRARFDAAPDPYPQEDERVMPILREKLLLAAQRDTPKEVVYPFFT